MAYIIHKQLFLTKQIQKVEIMNESTNLVLIYFCLGFTEFVPDPDVRYIYAWGLLWCLVVNLAINLIRIFVIMLKDLIKLIKGKWCKKGVPKHVKKLPVENRPEVQAMVQMFPSEDKTVGVKY